MYEVKCFSARPDFILYKDDEPTINLKFHRFDGEFSFNGSEILQEDC